MSAGNTDDYFIWTEIYNCGKIGRIALESFFKHHDLPVHVFGTDEDFSYIRPDKRIRFVKMTLAGNSKLSECLSHVFMKIEKHNYKFFTQRSLINSFRHGHLGTAKLWAYLIKSRREKFMVHFDSDVIFRGNCVDDILLKRRDFDLIGPIRNYKNNPNNRDDVRHLKDVCQTVCFGFNREKISPYSFEQLYKMCQGSYNPYGHPIIDFFDPVMFDILNNKGRICHTHHDDVGGCDSNGSRDNIFKEINNFNTPFKIDFGNKLIHFSAVGSGMNIHKNAISVNIPESYKQYALDRYALYCKIFYQEDIGIDLNQYAGLIDFFHKMGI